MHRCKCEQLLWVGSCIQCVYHAVISASSGRQSLCHIHVWVWRHKGVVVLRGSGLSVLKIQRWLEEEEIYVWVELRYTSCCDIQAVAIAWEHKSIGAWGQTLSGNWWYLSGEWWAYMYMYIKRLDWDTLRALARHRIIHQYRQACMESSWLASYMTQIIREASRQKWVNRCCKMIDEKEQFHEMIFSDDALYNWIDIDDCASEERTSWRSWNPDQNTLLRFTFGEGYPIEVLHRSSFFLEQSQQLQYRSRERHPFSRGNREKLACTIDSPARVASAARGGRKSRTRASAHVHGDATYVWARSWSRGARVRSLIDRAAEGRCQSNFMVEHSVCEPWPYDRLVSALPRICQHTRWCASMWTTPPRFRWSVLSSHHHRSWRVEALARWNGQKARCTHQLSLSSVRPD